MMSATREQLREQFLNQLQSLNPELYQRAAEGDQAARLLTQKQYETWYAKQIPQGTPQAAIPTTPQRAALNQALRTVGEGGTPEEKGNSIFSGIATLPFMESVGPPIAYRAERSLGPTAPLAALALGGMYRGNKLRNQGLAAGGDVNAMRRVAGPNVAPSGNKVKQWAQKNLGKASKAGSYFDYAPQIPTDVMEADYKRHADHLMTLGEDERRVYLKKLSGGGIASPFGFDPDDPNSGNARILKIEADQIEDLVKNPEKLAKLSDQGQMLVKPTAWRGNSGEWGYDVIPDQSLDDALDEQVRTGTRNPRITPNEKLTEVAERPRVLRAVDEVTSAAPRAAGFIADKMGKYGRGAATTLALPAELLADHALASRNDKGLQDIARAADSGEPMARLKKNKRIAGFEPGQLTNEWRHGLPFIGKDKTWHPDSRQAQGRSLASKGIVNYVLGGITPAAHDGLGNFAYGGLSDSETRFGMDERDQKILDQYFAGKELTGKDRARAMEQGMTHPAKDIFMNTAGMDHESRLKYINEMAFSVTDKNLQEKLYRLAEAVEEANKYERKPSFVPSLSRRKLRDTEEQAMRAEVEEMYMKYADYIKHHNARVQGGNPGSFDFGI